MFEGRDLLSLTDEEMRRIRGRRISMVFQDPASHLDPVMKVGDWIAEAIALHKGTSRKEAIAEAVRLLQVLKVPSPRDVLHAYPFQLSGGMCQRILIATAIATEPVLIIADEATSALDVTVQASILRTLGELTETIGTAVLLTTHNMRVVQKACSRVMVMYAGRVVETCRTEHLVRAADAPLYRRTSQRGAVARPHRPPPRSDARRASPPDRDVRRGARSTQDAPFAARSARRVGRRFSRLRRAG